MQSNPFDEYNEDGYYCRSGHLHGALEFAKECTMFTHYPEAWVDMQTDRVVYVDGRPVGTVKQFHFDKDNNESPSSD